MAVYVVLTTPNDLQTVPRISTLISTITLYSTSCLLLYVLKQLYLNEQVADREWKQAYP